ncbi:translation initiation factor IF-2 [Perkinsela sp. CCAP 1560/4]|nr:translation initiation factor IF-2 [Perkinsela sp. CCAP 1560/4]|eukprot:KNH04721.1 translation initiation factor IF-2 [Perkinsela sp. CCAP 1560/4]
MQVAANGENQSLEGCVLLDTSLGPIVIDLCTIASSWAVNNFLCLVNERFYDGDVFHFIHHSRYAEFGRYWKSQDEVSDPYLSTVNPNIYIDLGHTHYQGESIENLLRKYPTEFRSGFGSVKSGKSSSSLRFGCVFSSPISPGHEGARIRIGLCNDPSLIESHSEKNGTLLGIVKDCISTLDRFNCEDITKTDLYGKPLYSIQIRRARVLVSPSVNLTRNLSRLDSQVFHELCRKIVNEHGKYIKLSGITYDEKYFGLTESYTSGHPSKKEKKMRSQETLMEAIGNGGRKNKHRYNAFGKDRTLFVCRLSAMTSEDELQMFFSQFGEVTRCSMACNRNTGESLNYGFVEYRHVADALKAYEKTQGIVFGDHRILVDFYHASTQ